MHTQNDSQLGEDRAFVIAVGLDFSSPSQSALALAQSLAHEHSSTVIHVVHVTCLPDLSEGGVHVDVGRELERVRCACAPVTRELGSCVVCHVLIGRADDQLVQFSCDCHADVLILGGREKSSFERFFSTSTTRRIARAADCSVLVAHDPELHPSQETTYGLGSAQQRNPSE